MSRLRYNGLRTTLGASLTAGGTSITFAAALTHSGGTNVPTLTGTDYIPLAILDSNGHLSEIVWLTAYTSGGTTGTIVRGKEGTTGVSHSSGATVANGAFVTDVEMVKDLRWFPAPGELSIDEFNDSSLDAAWTRVDGTGAPSGNATWTEGADVLSVYNAGGDTTLKTHAIVRALSDIGGSIAVGDAFVTHLSYCCAAANYAVGGIILADSATYGSGNQVAASDYKSSTGHVTEAQKFSGFGELSAAGNNVTGQDDHFIRLVCTAANTWRADVSPDGVNWLLGTATMALTFTPTHVGLMSSSWGTSTKHVISYDYLRRLSGVS